jgi:nitroimidazol reductase NimA-like FMN-containing flavoprotein (pyridoxamine 5'-phosphate oxidase superfamily)
MPTYDIEQWEQNQAEIAIRRWLYAIGQWEPDAERAAHSTETETPGALDAGQIDQVLRSEVVGRIGCHANGQTYVVPVFYTYDGTYIYGHSHDGMKIRMLRLNPEVCFEVDHVDSLSNWQSVIAWGRFEELTGEQANLAEQQLIQRIKPLLGAATDQLPHPQSESGSQRAIIYRIALAERTGRYEQP